MPDPKNTAAEPPKNDTPPPKNDPAPVAAFPPPDPSGPGTPNPAPAAVKRNATDRECLYRHDCAGGRVFQGPEIDDALAHGWVDDPRKAKKPT